MSDRPAPRDARAIRTALLDDVSMEVSSHDISVVAKLHGLYQPGTRVFVTFVPGSDYLDTVNVAIAVQKAGFRAVPHLAVRSLKSNAELSDFISRVTGEAGIDHLLLIGGDPPKQEGPFAAAIDVIKTFELARHGIRHVALAGHPEGHPVMKADEPIRVLAEKAVAAREANLSPFIVTQFAFEAAPIAAWLKAVRDAGVDCPVRIGVAGPASITTLVKFAMRCGVGNSLRALTKRPQSFGKLLTDNTPDELIGDLAQAFEGIDGPLPQLHLFPFGGAVKAGKWLAQLKG